MVDAKLLILAIAAIFCTSVLGSSASDTREVIKLIHSIPVLGLSKKAQCGSWDNWYAKLHRQILLQPPRQQRLLVAMPNLSGLADRMVGLASVTLFGLLTNRAVQVGRRPGLPNFELVFGQPNVNWTRQDDSEWIVNPLRYLATERNYNSSVLSSKEYFGVNTIDNHQLQERLLTDQLDEVFGGKDVITVLISLNRGRTIRIFQKSPHVSQIQQMGLLPATTFGCIINFLFRPKPKIFVPLLPVLQRFKRAEGSLIIGIQIRAGDDQMFGRSAAADNVDHFEAYFNCASQIESFARLSSQPVVWFLVTDSLPLRKSAAAKYGDKLITSLDVPIEHSAKEESVCNGGRGDCSVSAAGFSAAAAEWWLLGATHYQVISVMSGYGRTAGMRSLNSNSIFSVGGGQGHVNCGLGQHTPLDNIANDWSGI